MRYVNLTPRWTEILPTWRMMIESGYAWNELKRMAEAADRYGDLITYLKNTQGWKDDRIKQALAAGREQNEIARTTIHEKED